MRVPLFSPATALCAAVTENLIGYPEPVWRRIRHPVVWTGHFIARLDRSLNRTELSRGERIMRGGAALTVTVAVSVATAGALAVAVRRSPILMGILASSCVARRSLAEHVEAVATGLERGGLAGGREAVAHIVGRDPATLDEAAVARAAIESLAENFSDGVVAPLFWCTVAGLPGAVFYKAVNTADSMIGHRSERYEAFGKVAARTDDVINLPASRLAALWLLLAAASGAGDWRGALRAVRLDAARHASPNAGWPEAAMAGALGLSLAGPRSYGGRITDGAWMGDGTPVATAADIRRALALYRRACLFQDLALGALTGLGCILRRRKALSEAAPPFAGR